MGGHEVKLSVVLALLGVLLSSAGARAEQGAGSDELLIFTGSCDGSAAVLLDDGRLLVSEDTNNILRYFSQKGGGPLATFDAYPITEVDPHSRRNFSAIEGAARLGDRSYWISSHSRQFEGKNRPNRRRFFALKTVAGSGAVEPAGVAFTRLLQILSERGAVPVVDLSRSIMIRHSQLPYLAPDKGGFNIAGLAAAKDGKGLLIGLRNPRTRGRAVVLPLENPAMLTRGPAIPRFGEPVLLDLGGLGISSLEYSPATDSYFVVAAPHDKSEGFKLYEWSGETAVAPVLLQDISPHDLAPEAMVVGKRGRRVLLLSDDGEIPYTVEDRSECSRLLLAGSQCKCTHLKDRTRAQFRGLWVDIVRTR